MAGTFLAYIDESGKQHSDLYFVLVSSIFEVQSFNKFDKAVGGMRTDPEISKIFPSKEVKLRRLLGKGGRALQALDIWAELLRRTDFLWHAAIVQKRSVPHHEQEAALEIIINGFSSEMEKHNSLGLPLMDEGYARVRHERKMPGVVGPPSFLPSHYSVGLWVSDGIAYLLHQRINRDVWHKSYKPVWDILKEKVVRSPDGFILGHGVKVFPESEDCEKKVLTLF